MTFADHPDPHEAWPGTRGAAIALTAAGRDGPRRLTALKRLALAGATAFIAANIWTGCPLLALWVGSQAVGQGTLSMAAVCVVILVLGALVFGSVVMLTWLNGVYDELTGRPRAESRARWLRSMRAEGEGRVSHGVGISALERIVMVNVYVAVITLLIWYVFFAGSPTPIFCNTHCY